MLAGGGGEFTITLLDTGTTTGGDDSLTGGGLVTPLPLYKEVLLFIIGIVVTAWVLLLFEL